MVEVEVLEEHQHIHVQLHHPHHLLVRHAQTRKLVLMRIRGMMKGA
jgi:hypothetical protein